MIPITECSPHSRGKFCRLTGGQGKGLFCLIGETEGDFVFSVGSGTGSAASGKILRRVKVVGRLQL